MKCRIKTEDLYLFFFLIWVDLYQCLTIRAILSRKCSIMALSEVANNQTDGFWVLFTPALDFLWVWVTTTTHLPSPIFGSNL